MSTEPTDTAERPAHLVRPHARPVQPLPVQNEGKQFIALRDPSMLIQQTMVIPPQALGVIQLFDGTLTIAEIAGRLVREDDAERETHVAEATRQIEALVEQMDKFGKANADYVPIEHEGFDQFPVEPSESIWRLHAHRELPLAGL